MSDSIRCLLTKAAENGEVISIIYNGGSQPGTVREISPISVADDEVRARDLASGIAKRFRLEKIELAKAGEKATQYTSKSAAVPVSDPLDGCTISTAFAERVIELKALGWHVELSENDISLYRRFKNGKPRKTPDVRLVYNEFVVDLVYDFDINGMKEERRKSKRPYRVESRALGAAHAISKLSRAVPEFWSQASELAPHATAH